MLRREDEQTGCTGQIVILHETTILHSSVHMIIHRISSSDAQLLFEADHISHLTR